MLEAQIENERAKGGRAEVDSDLKRAKTDVERAKAENIASSTDKTDLDYLQQYYGVQDKSKQAFELEKNKQNNDAKLTSETLKLLSSLDRKNTL